MATKEVKNEILSLNYVGQIITEQLDLSANETGNDAVLRDILYELSHVIVNISNFVDNSDKLTSYIVKSAVAEIKRQNCKELTSEEEKLHFPVTSDVTNNLVKQENTFVSGLCPRSWDNTDVSKLSENQINGILDNCEKCNRYYQCNKVAELDDKLKEIHNSGSSRIQKKAETFHNDINKVTDMLLCGKDEFLKSYPYLSEEDYYETMKNVIYNNSTLEQRKEYYLFLVNEGQEEYANKIFYESEWFLDKFNKD